MTAPLIGVTLLAACLIPLGAFTGLLHADTKWTAHRAEMDRLTAPLPAVREDLREPGVRRTPGKALAAEGYVDTGWVELFTPDELLLERVAAGIRGLDSERVNDEYHARHRADDKSVAGSSAQQAGRRALCEPTFDSLIAANWRTGEREALAWRCDVCRGVVAEGERAHESCDGCGCPCTMIGRSPLVGAL